MKTKIKQKISIPKVLALMGLVLLMLLGTSGPLQI